MKSRVLMIDGPEIAARVPLAQRLTYYDVVFAGAADHDRTLGGFEYHQYPLGRGFSPFSIPKTYWRLRQIIRLVQPTIVQTFMTSPGIWGRIAAKHERVPFIVHTTTGLGSLYGRDAGESVVKRVYERLLRYASSASSAVVFQNQRDLDEMVRRRVVGREKSLMIPGSGVDVDRFLPALGEEKAALRHHYGLGDDEFVFLMASRLLRSKGVVEYCRAANMLADRATFVLAGDVDPDSRDSLTVREAVDLTRNVIWPGRVLDIDNYLRAADAFVLPTRYREGVPRVVMEAMATGLPVVTTPEGSGGIQPGVVIDGYDAEAVRAGMEAVMEMSRTSRFDIGKWNRRYVERTLNIDVIAQQYGRLYRQMLDSE